MSSDIVRILGLSGSLRRKSFNTALLNAAIELAPAGVEIVRFDRIGALPHFNQDLEPDGDAEPVAALKAALQEADALLIASPEYNSGPPGPLKNAIDWASRSSTNTPLKGLAIGLMGASPGMGGTMRAQAQLRQTLSGLGALALPAPDVLVAQAGERFDADLRLTHEASRAAVAGLLGRLRDWAVLLKPGRPRGWLA